MFYLHPETDTVIKRYQEIKFGRAVFVIKRNRLQLCYFPNFLLLLNFTPLMYRPS